MLNPKDLDQITAKGISSGDIDQQIAQFKEGFPFMDLVKPATIGDGILPVDEKAKQKYMALYDELTQDRKIVKFVPASGAASRMFKKLFEFISHQKSKQMQSEEELSSNGFDFVYKFFKDIDAFAFYADLKEAVEANGGSIEGKARNFQLIVKKLLTPDGLNYGNLPKGLLKFHRYHNEIRTPVEEQMVEGAQYADSGNKVHLHFTVSPEHRKNFNELINSVKEKYEKQLGVEFHIEFSEQKPSTDTIAVDLNNEPFRLSDGSILFRPGGHGALIENLNDIDADIIFVKNIDNVAPDKLKPYTTDYKKVLGGVLLYYQQRIFEYLNLLDKEQYDISRSELDEIGTFLQEELCLLPSDHFEPKTKADQISCLIKHLNRPIRVCGMVKNEGEPGGGPFWVTNSDGSVSLQIVEGSQIDMSDPEKEEIVQMATHFNPVDLVCAVKDHNGQKFDLRKFRDPKTGFISQKSKDGRDLKALELPGLWNGAMSNWNTIFVEVPIETFNPVKTVNDLLRPQHQA